MMTERESKAAKSVLLKQSKTETHWVGDGFFVTTLIAPHPAVQSHFDPFILMDYAAPKDFPPSEKQRGVGEHPHRGFETVTFALQGEISHRDSGGGGGTIKEGGIQWMTAGSGVVHEELFSKDFSSRGGTLEMVQLWVNLAKKHKFTKPRYQGFTSAEIPSVELQKGAQARIYAGQLAGKTGPCLSHSVMNVFELTLSGAAAGNIQIPLAEGTNTLILVLRGDVSIVTQRCASGEVAVLSREGTIVTFSSKESARMLILNGEPLNEPIVAHGPFVMNTSEEINQAIADYQSGKMGQLK